MPDEPGPRWMETRRRTRRLPAGAPPARRRAGGATREARSAEDEKSPLQSGLSVLTTLGPPLTILTALLFYFGWARSDQQARAMGLDVSLFGYSTQDYVLRSIRTLYIPLLTLAFVLTAGLAGHWLVLRALDREPARPRLRTLGLAILSLGLVAAGGSTVWALVNPRSAPLLIPLILATGISVAAYGRWLANAAQAQSSATRNLPPWQRALRTLLVGSMITLALFWELSDFAGVVGRASAQQLAQSVSTMPKATVYSSTPLAIQAPGVREESLDVAADADPTAARFRTTGLRLLVRSGGRFFLLHDGWSPQNGTVIVLPDSETIRWQFSR